MGRLTDRDRRTIKLAGFGLLAYLVLFYGVSTWRYLESCLADHELLRLEASEVGLEVTAELKKWKRFRALREKWTIDLDSLDPKTVVSAAFDAIQTAAGKCGVGLGATQEIARRANAKELRVFQLQGSGATDSVMKFLHNLPRLGYPLVVDRLQVKGVPKKPGMLSVTLSVAILNFEAWQEVKKDA